MTKAPTTVVVRALRLPWWAEAEDTRFELVRGCPQHAFQFSPAPSGRVRTRSDLRCSRGWALP
jgi:hypothetical protein